MLAALLVTVAVAAWFHRASVAMTIDRRIAVTLGLHPERAHVVLVGLVTLAIVSSYQAVGSLLVVALLIAPAVAARPWAHRIPALMALASVFGAIAVAGGLLCSWHAGTAAGASVAACAVALAAVSGVVRATALRLVSRGSAAAARAAAAVVDAPVLERSS